MAFPVFHKASDLLSADNVNAANAALNRAIGNAARSFSAGMFNIGRTLEDARVSDIMSRIAGEQDRERYIQALNREDLSGLSSRALQQIAMTRPDQLLKNQQTEAQIFTALRQDLRNQHTQDELDAQRMASSELALAALKYGPQGAGLELPGILKRYRKSPAGLYAALNGAVQGKVPYYLSADELPTADDNTNIQIPWVTTNPEGKYILRKGDITNEAAIQGWIGGIDNWMNNNNALFQFYDDDGKYIGRTRKDIEQEISKRAEVYNKENPNKLSYTLDNFVTHLDRLRSKFKGQVPEDLLAEALFREFDSRTKVSRALGGSDTFNSDAVINTLTPYMNNRLPGLLTQRKQLAAYRKELIDAIPKLKNADITAATEAATYARRAKALAATNPAEAEMFNLLAKTAKYNRTLAYNPVLRSISGIAGYLYPDLLAQNSKPRQAINTAVSSSTAAGEPATRSATTLENLPANYREAYTKLSNSNLSDKSKKDALNMYGLLNNVREEALRESPHRWHKVLDRIHQEVYGINPNVPYTGELFIDKANAGNFSEKDINKILKILKEELRK